MNSGLSLEQRIEEHGLYHEALLILERIGIIYRARKEIGGKAALLSTEEWELTCLESILLRAKFGHPIV